MQKGRLMRGGREKCFLKLTAQPLTACANTAFSDYQREKQENSQLICHNSVFLIHCCCIVVIAIVNYDINFFAFSCETTTSQNPTNLTMLATTNPSPISSVISLNVLFSVTLGLPLLQHYPGSFPLWLLSHIPFFSEVSSDLFLGKT